MAEGKALFLCSRLADYFLHTIVTFQAQSGAEVVVIRQPNASEAPYEYEFPPALCVKATTEFPSEAALIAYCVRQSPSFVFVAGWHIRLYAKILSAFQQKPAVVLMGIDNPWKGNIRQLLGLGYFRLCKRSNYTHAWVAGSAQYTFARLLGFSHDRVLPYFYAANPRYQAPYARGQRKANEQEEATRQQKILLFVGRLVPDKGVRELYQAMNSLQPADWKLLLVGNGELAADLEPTDYVERLDFVQPRDLALLLAKAKAACLPAYQEHWGVVVHEFAYAGLPMILSAEVHAAQQFLLPGYNGWLCKPRDVDSLEQAMRALFATEEEALVKMGEGSRALADRITSEQQAYLLKALLPA